MMSNEDDSQLDISALSSSGKITLNDMMKKGIENEKTIKNGHEFSISG